MGSNYLKKSIFIIVLFTLSIDSFQASESDNNSNLKVENEVYNPVPSIMHHISDAHDWHLWGEGDESLSIPLPIILYTEGNLDIFMSSDFQHGNSKKIVNNHTYFIDHNGRISEESGLSFIDFSITKNVASMLMGLIVLLLIFGISGIKAKKNKGAPSGILSFLEPLVLFVRDDIVKPNIGKNYNKYLPYLLTLFFFILVNNLLGLLPGSANVTGNIAVTLVLSLITLVVTNLSGNKSYWGHIFNPPGVPLALIPIMIPIEIVGIFTNLCFNDKTIC